MKIQQLFEDNDDLDDLVDVDGNPLFARAKVIHNLMDAVEASIKKSPYVKSIEVFPGTNHGTKAWSDEAPEKSGVKGRQKLVDLKGVDGYEKDDVKLKKGDVPFTITIHLKDTKATMYLSGYLVVQTNSKRSFGHVVFGLPKMTHADGPDKEQDEYSKYSPYGKKKPYDNNVGRSLKSPERIVSAAYHVLMDQHEQYLADQAAAAAKGKK